MPAAVRVDTGEATGIVRRVPTHRVSRLIPDPVRMRAAAAAARGAQHRPGRFAFHGLPAHASGRPVVDARFAVLATKRPERAEPAGSAAAARAIAALAAADGAHRAAPLTRKQGAGVHHRPKDELARAPAAGAPRYAGPATGATAA